MEQFIQDNKYVIPENEIDNVYIWTRLSKTEKVLLSSEEYFILAKETFNKDIADLIPAVKRYYSPAKASMYQFSDFITFNLNRHRLFNGSCCFCMASNLSILQSLCIYLIQSKLKFNLVQTHLSNLVFDRIDDYQKYKTVLECELLFIEQLVPLGNHEYKEMILDNLLFERSKSNRLTLMYLQNIDILSNDIPKQVIENSCLVDLTKMVSLFNARRNASYQSLMKDWYSMMAITDNVTYSKTKPEERIKKVDRYTK